MADYVDQPNDFDSEKAEQLKKELEAKRVREANLESNRKIIAAQWTPAKDFLKKKIVERVSSINQKDNAEVLSAKEIGPKLILTNKINENKCAITFNDTTHRVLLDGGYCFSFKVNGTDSGSFFQDNDEISSDEISQFAINLITPNGQ